MIVAPNSLANENKIAMNVFTTVTASDSVPTGIRTVDQAVASFQDDLVLGAAYCTAVPDPNVPGNILIKSWKPTSATDPTPIAATTFGKKVAWLAGGR